MHSQARPFSHFQHRIEQVISHFYISEAIIEPFHYTEMIHSIRYASPHDLIYIHLNTTGGNAFTAIQIIQAMRESEAHIITSMEGQCCSAGTLIFLSGREYLVHEHSLAMIHNYSSGVSGKGHEQRAQFEAIDKWFYKLAREIYIPFLNEDEFEKVISGSDLWLTADEVAERLNVMIDFRQAEADKLATENEEACDEKHTCCKPTRNEHPVVRMSDELNVKDRVREILEESNFDDAADEYTEEESDEVRSKPKRKQNPKKK